MPDDLTEREERIRALAHRMWEAAGRPGGPNEYFWSKAEAEMPPEIPPGFSDTRGAHSRYRQRR